MIAHGFFPIEHAGSFRATAFAKHLPKSGIVPVVLSASDLGYNPTYAENTAIPAELSTIQIARIPWGLGIDGAATSFSERVMQRLPVMATLVTRSHRNKFITENWRFVCDMARRSDVQAIYATSPPEEALLLGAEVADHLNVPFVADLRDPWSYAWSKRYRHWVDFHIERRLEIKTLTRAAAIIANTPKARQLLLEHLQVPANKVVVIPNGFEPQPPSISQRVSRSLFRIVYTGQLSAPMPTRSWRRTVKRSLGMDYSPIQSDPTTRSVKWILEAVKKVLDRCPELSEVLRVIFVGHHLPETKQFCDAFPAQSVVSLHPPVGHLRARELCATADLLLLLQVEMRLKSEDFCTAVPGKLYDYLETGVEILAPLQRGDARDLIRDCEAGYTVNPRDTDAIAESILKAVKAWQLNKQELHVPKDQIQRFTRESLTAELSTLILRTVSQHSK